MSATGLYELQDLLIVGIGLIPLIVGVLPSKKKRGRKKGSGADKKLAKRMRSAKLKISIGLTFFILIVLDSLGHLSPDGPIDFEKLTGLPLPSVIIYSVIGLLGLRSILNGMSKRKHTLGLVQKHEEGGGMEDFLPALFCLGFIGATIASFAMGYKWIGYGALASMVAAPAIFVVTCFVVIFTL